MKKLISLQRYLALFLFLVLCPKLQEDSLLEARMNQMRKNLLGAYEGHISSN